LFWKSGGAFLTSDIAGIVPLTCGFAVGSRWWCADLPRTFADNRVLAVISERTLIRSADGR
jgi:hypothetical protein